MASRKVEEESLRSRRGAFLWVVGMCSAISRRWRRGKMVDGLERHDWEEERSTAGAGALLGPGRGDGLDRPGRVAARSGGRGSAEMAACERRCTGGGTNVGGFRCLRV